MFKTFFAAALLGFSSLLSAADPTQPPRGPLSVVDQPKRAQASLKLQAILRTTGTARAVINGRTLRVGEQVAGARVLAIGERSVRLERQGQRITLPLVASLFPSSNSP